MQELRKFYIDIKRKLLKAISPYRKAVLIDTNVISRLAESHESTKNLSKKAYRRVSKKWWDSVQKYKLIISAIVWEEAADGDIEENVTKRKQLINDMERLEVNDEIRKLAKELMKEGIFRPNAKNDAYIFATCCVRHVGTLVSWNMNDLVGNKNKAEMTRIVEQYPYSVPEIIDPKDFLINKLGITGFTIPVKSKK